MTTLAYLGRRNGNNGPWTAARIAQLVELWAEGFSASQIVRLIGNRQITRCSILGKARRLGLPRRKLGRRPRMRGRRDE